MAIPMMIDSILMITLKLHRTTRVKYAAPLTILPLAGPNMRNIVTAALAVLAMLPAASPADSDLARIDRAAQDVAGKVVEWRRDFHRNPELSNREFRTAEKVSAHLRSLGLEVRTGVAHTGVVGVLRGGREGPVIALRADMDALPVTERADVPFRSTATAEYRGEQVGVMHACGHDGHTAILMGLSCPAPCCSCSSPPRRVPPTASGVGLRSCSRKARLPRLVRRRCSACTCGRSSLPTRSGTAQAP